MRHRPPDIFAGVDPGIAFAGYVPAAKYLAPAGVHTHPMWLDLRLCCSCFTQISSLDCQAQQVNCSRRLKPWRHDCKMPCKFGWKVFFFHVSWNIVIKGR
mmetsp:Transcript_23690/g.40955  ORF Transcript_23690/g.40955 Transcript_23690/m.40955 type:complete len:100 (-) Transcript_23690:883-1182(-)